MEELISSVGLIACLLVVYKINKTLFYKAYWGENLKNK